MYPPETSLIPVTVALARFVEGNGFASMFGHYPYWYLGVPYQYLTGPIIPLLQVFLHRIIPGLSLFEITYVLLVLSFLASVVGWGVLANKVSGKRFIGLVISVLLVVLPWRYLSALALSEASGVIAGNLLPFVLLAFWNYYQAKDRKSAVFVVLATSVLLLINTSVFSILIVGLVSIVLAASFKKQKIRNISRYIKPTILLTTYSILLVTFWYTPGYWWTVINNPSIGGASGIKVFIRIFDLLKASIPLVLAVITVYFSGKIRSRLSVFSLIWVFTFLFLTVFRFIGDPDFWQDWTSWLSELEIGLALLASKVIYDLRLNISGKKPPSDKKIPTTYYILLATLLVPFYLTWRIHLALGQPQLILAHIPQGVQSLEKLNEIVEMEKERLPREAAGEVRVFLSGSTVFWANSIYDLNQVRGGVDKAANHPYWDHAAFQLREGTSAELAEGWLESLGVSYVLVHGASSPEAYHDFRNLSKWQEVGEVVWGDAGDLIIRVSSSSLAWVVDLETSEKAKSPKGGNDLNALVSSLSAKKRPLKVRQEKIGRLAIEVDQLNSGEAIILAVAFDNLWREEGGTKLKKDALGNILILPEDYFQKRIVITYR